MNRPASAGWSLALFKQRLVEWSATLTFWLVMLFFAYRVWRAIQGDPQEYERWLGHGMLWFGVMCAGQFLFLFFVLGLIAGCLLPCVGYSQEPEPAALITLSSSIILLFVVGLAGRAVDGLALVGYLLVLNAVAHGIAALMELVGLGIRARSDQEGWLRSGWMGCKRLLYFGVTGYSLMMLTLWWVQDPADSRTDAEVLAAATQGNAAAQNSWAVRLERRGEREEAVEWLNKAVAQGNQSAMCNLSVALRTSDPERALALVKEAADQGYLRAQYMLGRYHRDGVGTPVDKVRAAELFRDAAFAPGGYPAAMNDLMVLIHSELPDSFRSSLFEKLRDGEAQTLEQALTDWKPTSGEAPPVLEVVDEVLVPRLAQE